MAVRGGIASGFSKLVWGGNHNLGQMCGPIRGEVCFGCLACGAENDAWFVFERQDPLLKLLGFREAGSAGEALPKESLMSAHPWLTGIQGRPGG